METVQLSPEFMEEFYKENPEFKDMDMTGWCECEEQGNAIFHDDHSVFWQNCVDKHHYHCNNCKGLIQIG